MKFRKATTKDVPSIVKMIADDNLGKLRENYQDPLPQTYYKAFENINKDLNQVVENDQTEIIGTLQLSYLQYLTYQGGIRAQIEAVRIKREFRGKGIGKLMFQWAIERAKYKNAHVLQLTTDKSRPDAILFYEKLGFKASH